MKNFKKALALVLAAATVFTFAPVSSFAAAGDHPTTDGLTTTKGIDSNPAGVTLKLNGSDYAVTWLKEHEDKSKDASGNTVEVHAFKVSVQRYWDGTAKVYKDAVGLYSNTTDPTQTPTFVNTTNQINDTVSGTAATYDKLTAADTDGSLSTRTYIIKNTVAAKNADGEYASGLGGAYIGFKSLSFHSGKYTVTVTAMGSMDENSTPLESQTFDVTIPGTDEVLSLQKTAVKSEEDQDAEVPYTIANFATSNDPHIEYLEIESDNTDVAKITGYTSSLTTQENLNKGVYHLAATSVGKIKFHVGEAGSATITVQPFKANGDAFSGEQTIEVTVGAKNAKLYVSYNAADGKYRTYTDDIAYVSGSDQNTNLIKSDTAEVKKGTLTHGTTLVSDWAGNPYYTDGGQTKTDASRGSDLTKYNSTEIQSMSYTDQQGIVPVAATPLNADSNKTVQISATTSAPGYTISYSLVAPVKEQYTYPAVNASALTTKATTTTTSDSLGDGYVWVNTPLGGIATYVKVASKFGAETTVKYTEDAARKYGAIDNSGLVTLKGGDDVTLYAVVTATKKDATTSTFMIPVSMHQQTPVVLYVANDDYFVQDESGYSYAADYINRADYAVYLNLKDKNTDKLNIWSNAGTNGGSSYYTGSSSDESVVTYNNGVLTAKKEGTAYVTIKTTSAPNVSGIQTARIKVVVNNKADNKETLSYNSVAVSKDSPTAQIDAKSSVAGATVIYDNKNLWKIDDTRTAPRNKFRAVTSDDDEYNSIRVSSTGNIAYNKNAGTVYVRAYAAGTDKTNPSTWTYIPVNYGQKVVDTQLNVDTTPIILDVKGTKQIDASVSTTGAAITYTSADPTIASVDANGLVTANKSGVTSIKVATTSDGKEGSSANIAVVVRGNATVEDDVKTPSKVTGVKVTNLKGGKVKVTWTKQNQKNIKYYVKKTVGKKSAGKSVGSNKTTLSVKKGATVKVKVKAYIYDATGKKLVGSYSKTITKKTDKK